MIFVHRRTKLVLGAVLVLALIISAFAYYAVSFPAPERKPLAPQDKPYEYYIIVDEDNGKTLAFVTTVVVSVGDEYLNENGQWYMVVRVEENRAYARRFEKQR